MKITFYEDKPTIHPEDQVAAIVFGSIGMICGIIGALTGTIALIVSTSH